MTRFEHRLAVGCLNERSFAEVGSRSRVPWRSNEAQSRITGNFVPSRRWRAQENCRAMPPAIKVANVLRGTRYPVDRSQVSHLVHDRGFRCRWKLTYVRTRPFRYLSPKDPLAESQRFLAFSLAIFEYAKFSPAKRKVGRCDNRSYFLLALSLSLSFS